MSSSTSNLYLLYPCFVFLCALQSRFVLI
uniref:Uncharacterized protein n=1 Tax=Arundo donax TaxID=35708 RepID=A0A0A9EQ16_ARUDO